MTAVVFLLPLENTSVLCFQLQSLKLPLVKRICRRPHRKDCVEVVTLPLQSVFIEVAGGLRPISNSVLTLFIAVFFARPVAAAMVL